MKSSNFTGLRYQDIFPDDKEESKIPVCIFTQQPLEDPVMDACGHSFEKSAIKNYIPHEDNVAYCPLNRKMLLIPSVLTPNTELKTLITETRELEQEIEKLKIQVESLKSNSLQAEESKENKASAIAASTQQYLRDQISITQEIAALELDQAANLVKRNLFAKILRREVKNISQLTLSQKKEDAASYARNIASLNTIRKQLLTELQKTEPNTGVISAFTMLLEDAINLGKSAALSQSDLLTMNSKINRSKISKYNEIFKKLDKTIKYTAEKLAALRIKLIESSPVSQTIAVKPLPSFKYPFNLPNKLRNIALEDLKPYTESLRKEKQQLLDNIENLAFARISLAPLLQNGEEAKLSPEAELPYQKIVANAYEIESRTKQQRALSTAKKIIAKTGGAKEKSIKSHHLTIKSQKLQNRSQHDANRIQIINNIKTAWKNSTAEAILQTQNEEKNPLKQLTELHAQLDAEINSGLATEENLREQYKTNVTDKMPGLIRSHNRLLSLQRKSLATKNEIAPLKQQQQLLMEKVLEQTIQQTQDKPLVFGGTKHVFKKLHISAVDIEQNEEKNNDKEYLNSLLLTAAATSTNDKEVLSLLNRGANIEASNASGFTPLIIALLNNNVAIVKLLVDQGANCNIIFSAGDNSTKLTPLIMLACDDRLKQIELATALLGSKTMVVDAIADTTKQETALHYAAVLSNYALVQLLLKNHADPTLKNHLGLTPAESFSARYNIKNSPIISLLSAAEKAISDLFVAASAKNIMKVMELIRNGVAINACIKGKHIVRHLAALNNFDTAHLAIVRAILETNKYLMINHVDNAGDTPLHWAAHLNYLELTKLLLEFKADPRILNNANKTPLQDMKSADKNSPVAIILKQAEQNFLQSSQEQEVKHIVKEHKITQQDLDNALLAAVLHDNLNEATWLLTQQPQANPNTIDRASSNPLLIIAFNKNNTAMMAVLTANGADPNLLVDDEQNKIPLLVSLAKNNRVEMLSTLLYSRVPVKIDEIDHKGDTALHWATFRGYLQIVELLLDKNASTTIKNSYGRTPLEEALFVKEVRRDTPQIVAIQNAINRKSSSQNNFGR